MRNPRGTLCFFFNGKKLKDVIVSAMSNAAYCRSILARRVLCIMGRTVEICSVVHTRPRSRSLPIRHTFPLMNPLVTIHQTRKTHKSTVFDDERPPLFPPPKDSLLFICLHSLLCRMLYCRKKNARHSGRTHSEQRDYF